MEIQKYSVGDRFEGVLVETCKEAKVSRPRVKAIEYFEEDIRVEFPRSLREENPLGTRFRADVKVCQKSKNGQPTGSIYLYADEDSIIKVEDFKPSVSIKAVKLNTASDRSYDYIKEEFKQEPKEVSFLDIRNKAIAYSVENPELKPNSKSFRIVRSDLIKTYALTRAGDICEACEKPAPFNKKNGEPYLEVHHLVELSKGGSDAPNNVSAICPNCHARVTHGADANLYNETLISKIVKKEIDFGDLK